MRVQYKLKKKKKNLFYKFINQTQKQKNEKFDEAFRRKTDVYLLQQYKAEEIQKKIEQKLEQISNEREELLKEAWSIAYKLCDDKEKQKSNMVS